MTTLPASDLLPDIELRNLGAATGLLHHPEIVRDYAKVHYYADMRSAPPFDFATHLDAQREWSEQTFGPGPRVGGVVAHIRKELGEIEAKPNDLSEWIDVMILSADGALRQGYTGQQIVEALVAKQRKNEARDWPDWRLFSADEAIEHVRTHDEVWPDGNPYADGKRRPILLGCDARQAGAPLSSNPFPSGSTPHCDWATGWSGPLISTEAIEHVRTHDEVWPDGNPYADGKRRPILLGCDARQAGAPLSSNPFPSGSTPHCDWATGWSGPLISTEATTLNPYAHGSTPPFERGVDAWFADVSEDQNPFEFDSAEYHQWADGWTSVAAAAAEDGFGSSRDPVT